MLVFSNNTKTHAARFGRFLTYTDPSGILRGVSIESISGKHLPVSGGVGKREYMMEHLIVWALVGGVWVAAIFRGKLRDSEDTRNLVETDDGDLHVVREDQIDHF